MELSSTTFLTQDEPSLPVKVEMEVANDKDVKLQPENLLDEIKKEEEESDPQGDIKDIARTDPVEDSDFQPHQDDVDDDDDYEENVKLSAKRRKKQEWKCPKCSVSFKSRKEYADHKAEAHKANDR